MIVIVPSFTPQSVTLVEATLVMTGSIGATSTSGAAITTQVPSAFLTAISYEPSANPVNVFEFCQEPAAPPLIEY